MQFFSFLGLKIGFANQETPWNSHSLRNMKVWWKAPSNINTSTTRSTESALNELQTQVSKMILKYIHHQAYFSSGYTKVRCVDDPSTFTVSKSVSPNEQPSSIHEDEEEDQDKEEEDDVGVLRVYFYVENC